MKNLLSYAAVTALISALLPLTLAAEEEDTTAFSGSITVTYTGTASGPQFPNCPAGNVWIEAHGIGYTSLGPLFMAVRKCLFLSAGTYAGTFALCPLDAQCTADSPNAVSGTYAGSQGSYTGDFPDVFGAFSGTLTIERGNGRFKGATGTLDFTAIGANFNRTIGNAYYRLKGSVSFPEE